MTDHEKAKPAPVPARPDLAIPYREFIVLTALLTSLTAMSIDIMLPALPQIGATFGVAGANDQQLVVTVYFLGLASGQLFYGPLSDRYGRKPLLLAGLSIYLVAALACVTVGSFKYLLWARFLQGFGGAASRVLAVAIVRDLFAGRAMARVMSTVMTVFIAVPVFAPAVGQAIAGLGGWRGIFLFLIAIALLDMAWSWLRMPETRGAHTSAGIGATSAAPGYLNAIGIALSNRVTVGYTLASGFLFGCLTTYVASAQQLFVDVYALGPKFPLVFGLIASSIAVASFANTKLVMRYGMRRVSHMALCGFLVIGVALALASAGGRPPLALFGLLMAGAFFSFGLTMSNFNAISMQPMGQVSGTASSLTGFYTTASGATFGWLIAQRFDGTVRPICLGFLALGVLTAAMIVATEGRDRLFKGE